MRIFLKLAALGASLALLGAALGVVAAVAAYLHVAPELPSVESLREVQFQVPLRVYSRDGRLLAEFGEKRRTPVSYEEMPLRMVQAITAAEDDRFFEHPGVDYQGLLRAAVSVLLTGEKRQGGSTITMQVARNFFLSREKTYLRKIREIFLSLRIERELSKQEILELYLNKILLGHRAYGVGAAAEVYYGKTVDELNLAEIATIAGLPKAPSSDNPISNPERARERRSYVLRRMLELGHISQAELDAAHATPIETELHGPEVALDAPYLAEMVRARMVERFGQEAAYSDGYRVTTTLDSRLQASAATALRASLLAYDERHGYRGPVARVALPAEDDASAWTDALRDYSAVGPLHPAVVIDSAEAARVYVAQRGMATLETPDFVWAQGYVDDYRVDGKIPERASDVLAVGDIIYVRRDEQGEWRLSQVPDVQGAFVAVSPQDGAVVALSGGFDYYASKFNRAVQAQRQPGSAFKPFIFSAALSNGFTPATIVNDAPVVFEDDRLEDTWRPENYSQRFYGPTRLREALVRSRNLVSIRVLREIGVRTAAEHLQQFGFDDERLPKDLSLALGSISLSPLELATAYAIFANGGYRVEPYFIERIEAADGKLLFAAEPRMVCGDCRQVEDLSEAFPRADEVGECTGRPFILAEQAAPQVLDPQTAWLVVDMMRDVVTRGTAVKAAALGRTDLAGKTGTTNDNRDAWFSGFNDRLVATVWVGFDQERPLGSSEVGGTAALPAWIDFMRVALAGVEENTPITPPGLVRVRISPETGLLTRADDQDAIFEVFRVGHVPELEPEKTVDIFQIENDDGEEEQPLF